MIVMKIRGNSFNIFFFQNPELFYSQRHFSKSQKQIQIIFLKGSSCQEVMYMRARSNLLTHVDYSSEIKSNFQSNLHGTLGTYIIEVSEEKGFSRLILPIHLQTNPLYCWHKQFWQMSLTAFKALNLSIMKTRPYFHPPVKSMFTSNHLVRTIALIYQPE